MQTIKTMSLSNINPYTTPGLCVNDSSAIHIQSKLQKHNNITGNAASSMLFQSASGNFAHLVLVYGTGPAFSRLETVKQFFAAPLINNLMAINQDTQLESIISISGNAVKNASQVFTSYVNDADDRVNSLVGMVMSFTTNPSIMAITPFIIANPKYIKDITTLYADGYIDPGNTVVVPSSKDEAVMVAQVYSRYYDLSSSDAVEKFGNQLAKDSPIGAKPICHNFGYSNPMAYVAVVDVPKFVSSFVK